MAKLTQELQTDHFQNEWQKAHLNILFTAGWLKSHLLGQLKPYKVSLEQYNVLRILRGKHPQSVCLKDISERMIDRNSNTTRIIQKLETKGLVHKSNSVEDRRELSIVISREGLALLEKAEQSVENQHLQWANLTETEAQLLNALLDKLRG